MTLDITAIDNYCGAGGSTTGLKAAGIRVIHAANHWKLAIETHNTNHPEVNHSCVDLNNSDPRYFPKTTIAWFSPECQTHSPAGGRKRKKSGQIHLWEQKAPEDPSVQRSRMTAFDVIRFTEVHKYEIVVVENVLQFLEWGEDETGDMFQWWLKGMTIQGYEHQIVCFNSQFAYPNPVPQSRDRIYIVFHKKGGRKPNVDFRPPATCLDCGRVQAKQTWKWNIRHKRFNSFGIYGSLESKRGQYYYACPTCNREVIPDQLPAKVAINWMLPCPKIKDRKKPLSENTLRRIERGLKRFSLLDLNLEQPSPTVTRNQEFTISQDFLIHYGYSSLEGHDRLCSIEDPSPTQTTKRKLYLVEPFIAPGRTDNMPTGIGEPIHTLTANNQQWLVQPPFIDTARTNSTASSIDEPTSTVTTSRHLSVIQPPPFLTAYHGGRDATHSLSNPAPTIATNNQFAWVEPFISSYYGKGGESSISQPSPTMRTTQGHALIEPDWAGIVQECGYRMITAAEAKLLMGFPLEYVILGNQEEQFKQEGNAVTPSTAEMIGRAIVEALS
jgi:DNA (cytosine-5)-methyltransferase 1